MSNNYSFIIYKGDRGIREGLAKSKWGKSKGSAGRTHRIPSIGERLKKKVIPQWNRRFVESVDLPVKDIAETAPDVKIDKGKVNSIMECIKRGDKIEPICVREDSINKGKWLVTDGNHRLVAHRLAGKFMIKANKVLLEQTVNSRSYVSS